MITEKSFIVEFAAKVLLPSMAAAFIISLFLHSVFTGIVERADALDEDRAQRAALSAVELLGDNLRSTALRAARHDSATPGAYGNDRQQWLENVWQAGQEPARRFNGYDSVFLVDAQNITLASAAASKGGLAPLPVESLLGEGFLELLSQLPVSAGQPASVSTFIEQGGVIHLAGVAEVPPPAQGGMRPHRIIFSKAFDAEVLSAVAQQFELPELRLATGAEKAGAGLDLVSWANRPLARLAWSGPRQGDVLQQDFGRQLWVTLVLFNLITYLLVYVSWLGFRDANESRIAAMRTAEVDALTGLANRRKLIETLRAKVAAARADGGSISTIYTDLDGFKEVNDVHGHAAGDELLKAVAKGFDRLSPGKDLLARLGGDEFAMLVSGRDSAARAQEIALGLIEYLAKPLDIGGRTASVTVSVGIVNVESGAADVEEILRRADTAMYAAKQEGHNRLRVYDEDLDRTRLKNRAMADSLREAIRTGTFRVMYQPIVSVQTHQAVGVEALARWPNGDGPIFGPNEFIPVAEEFGLIEELGNYVLAKACRQAVQWPDIYLAVNVSSLQLRNPAYSSVVERILAEAGLEPARLEIEVTESFVFGDTTNAAGNLNSLRGLGISIALDDFGTGYSSISHLRQFKFDKLKLDRSMVEGIPQQPAALRLATGTIAMAEALGIRVTAEGVERQDQLMALRQLGCGECQGYYFSTPIEAAEIPRILASPPLANTA